MTIKTLPEYEGNPFIEGLGPPRSSRELIALMTAEVGTGEADRKLPRHLRRHCLHRIKRWMQPRACQLELADTIDTMLRQAYIGRNPATGSHHAAILDAADRRQPGDLSRASTHGVNATSMGFALLGHPGMGKTTSLERIIASYPDVVEHKLERAVLKQVPIVKAEMPAFGSLKTFCIDLIRQIGRRVGMEGEFKQLYLHSRATIETMLLDLQRIVQLHAVGLLVVDEMQHLNQSRDNPQQLMNFLTSLANVHGVSVIPVGTMGATPILEEQFRVARRAAGEPRWTRLRQGPEWDAFAAELVKMQWVRQPVPPTEELTACLYDECQGILDLAVKLFMVAQRTAIWRGEANGEEAITAELLRETAQTHFHIVQPMVLALRASRPDQLVGFSDLEVLRRDVDSMLAGESSLGVDEVIAMREQERKARRAAPSDEDDWRRMIEGILRKEGHGDDVIEGLLVEVERASPGGSFLARMKTLHDLMDGTLKPSSSTPGGSKMGSAVVAAAPKRPSRNVIPVTEVDDLRFIAQKAREAGIGVHEAFVDAGVCRSLSSILGGT